LGFANRSFKKQPGQAGDTPTLGLFPQLAEEVRMNSKCQRDEFLRPPWDLKQDLPALKFLEDFLAVISSIRFAIFA